MKTPTGTKRLLTDGAAIQNEEARGMVLEVEGGARSE
jgi:hypothetical protein